MVRNQEIRKVGVTGKTKSYFVTLPKYMARSLGLKKGQQVVIEQRPKGIFIKNVGAVDSIEN